MPSPTTLFSFGNCCRGRSRPNSARDNVKTTERNRMEEPHFVQVGVSRFATGAADRFGCPHRLHVNAPRGSTLSSPLFCGTSYLKPRRGLSRVARVKRFRL